MCIPLGVMLSSTLPGSKPFGDIDTPRPSYCGSGRAYVHLVGDPCLSHIGAYPAHKTAWEVVLAGQTALDQPGSTKLLIDGG